MPSKHIVHASQLYIDKRDSLCALPLINPTAIVLDPIEYGMGFQRGEMNEFVGSDANKITLQRDMAEAFDNNKWSLVPEQQHLEYLVQLWYDNLHCPVDERARYIPLKKGLRVSKSGRTFYPYSLYRLDSFPIYTVDGTLTQSGATRVWSSIPPYIWLVAASIFLHGQYLHVPGHLCSQKWRLRVVYDMARCPMPRTFIDRLPQPQRPTPYVREVEDAQAQDVP
ncbi:hypothetical protein C0993_000284 [Termitomyces sp. T159_Od127]|nr:hypothetical protein C0993_000284 [Termitomyces sp. T159_Od127]